jgi:hypothetical protein
VIISTAQIAKALCRINYTSNVVTIAAAERNDELITAFRRKVMFWDASYICFINESADNERTAYRRRGWVPRGAPASVKRLLESVTIVP